MSIMLSLSELAMIAGVAAPGAGRLNFSGAHPRAYPVSCERSAGRPRRRHSGAANWPPNTSPRSSLWPEPNRRATTATYFQKVPLVGRGNRSRRHSSHAHLSGQERGFPMAGRFRGRQPDPAARRAFRRPAPFSWVMASPRPEFKWDDFKGVDVTGKMLLMFTNEPPSSDPKFFDGPALTYYGRWTYKYEEALRRGARGVHHHPHHSHRGLRLGRGAQFVGPRNAVRETGAGRQSALARWLDDAGCRRATAGAGRQERRRTAGRLPRSPDFRPIDLGHCDSRPPCSTKVRELDTPQRGRHGAGKRPEAEGRSGGFQRALGPSRHRHAGNGDAIYNGAIDNATGCAILLELARAWAALPQKPKRSALFLGGDGGRGRAERLGILRRAPADSPGQDGRSI